MRCGCHSVSHSAVLRYLGLSGRRVSLVELLLWPCRKARCAMPGSARPPRMSSASPIYRLHSAVTVHADTAHRDSGSAPLLPGLTRSLRSVSVILTSPPQQAKRARSGSLQLHSAQPAGGETNPKPTGRDCPYRWPWKVQAKPPHMTVESAQGATLRAARTHTGLGLPTSEACKRRGHLGLFRDRARRNSSLGSDTDA